MNKRAKDVFARLIRHRREMLGISQRELAGRLGMPQGTVSAWETGKAFPDGLNLIYLEMALGWEEGELLRQWKRSMVERGWLPQSLRGSLSGGSGRSQAQRVESPRGRGDRQAPPVVAAGAETGDYVKLVRMWADGLVRRLLSFFRHDQLNGPIPRLALALG